MSMTLNSIMRLVLSLVLHVKEIGGKINLLVLAINTLELRYMKYQMDSGIHWEV